MISLEESERIFKSTTEYINAFGKKGIPFTAEDERMFSSWKESFINDGYILNLDFNFLHNEENQTLTPFMLMKNFAGYISNLENQKLSQCIMDKAISYVYSFIYYQLVDVTHILSPEEDMIDISFTYDSYYDKENKKIGMELIVILTDKRIVTIRSYPHFHKAEEIILELGEVRKASQAFGKIISIAMDKRIVVINLDKLLKGNQSFFTYNLSVETPNSILIVPSEEFLSAPQDYTVITVTDKNTIVYESIFNKDDCVPTVIPMVKPWSISWRMVEREVKILLIKKKVQEPHIMIQSQNLYGYKFIKSHINRVEMFIKKAAI